MASLSCQRSGAGGENVTLHYRRTIYRVNKKPRAASFSLDKVEPTGAVWNGVDSFALPQRDEEPREQTPARYIHPATGWAVGCEIDQQRGAAGANWEVPGRLVTAVGGSDKPCSGVTVKRRGQNDGLSGLVSVSEGLRRAVLAV